MAKGDLVHVSEEVVRAGMYPYWDADLNRVSPSAFTASEVSVSRLAILDFAEINSIFKKDFGGRFHRDGDSMAVRGTGRSIVKIILEQAELPMDDKNNGLPNVVLTVVEDEIKDEVNASDNPAHALICGWDRGDPTKSRKITRGVAKRLVDVFRWEPLID
jgi:hypothetical protein